MSNYLTRRVEAKENIEILTHTEIRRMVGGKSLEAIELENTKTGEKRTVQVSAVFSVIGAKPCTAWLPPEIERDEKGFIETGHAVAHALISCRVVSTSFRRSSQSSRLRISSFLRLTSC